MTGFVLVSFNEKRKLIHVTLCVGTVISHVTDDGEEQPIAFVYKEWEKLKTNSEGRSGCYFWRITCMDVCFICIVTILVPKAAVPTLTAARMQHWRVIAHTHNYQVKYWPSKERGHADALSRLPCNKRPLKEEAEILFFSGLEDLPIDTEKDISGETRRDLVLERVPNYTLTGWQNCVSNEELKPYFTRGHEL